MRYLHTMVRITNLDSSLHFYCNLLGLKEVQRKEVPQGRFTLIFLATEPGAPEVELTYNWDADEALEGGRNFGHLAYEVDDIYEKCQYLKDNGVAILRPPRDGRMAFVRSPDNISVELLQKGEAMEPREPWASMQNQGQW